MTQHITQERADKLAGNAHLEAAITCFSYDQTLCNTAIQYYIDQQAKDLPELPEPVCLAPDYELDYMQTHDCGAVYKCGSAGAHENDADISLYTADQLKVYGAACAAHARELALSEAVQEAVKRHNAGEVGAVLISRAIEQLKAKK